MPTLRHPRLPPVRGGRGPADAFVEHGLLVELVDIAEREDWVEQYGLRIPVLRRNDTGAELNWPFDAEQVVTFLR